MGARDDAGVRSVTKAGTPPGRREFELTLLGPGYGESIVLHVGDGIWILVDSCLDTVAPCQVRMTCGGFFRVRRTPTQLRISGRPLGSAHARTRPSIGPSGSPASHFEVFRCRPARFDCGDRAARGCSGVSRSSAPRAISRTSPSNRALGIHHSPSSMFGVTTSTPRELVQVALVRRERHCPGSTICGAVEAVHRMWPARAGRIAIHPRVPPKIPRRRRHGRRHHHRAIVSRPQSPSARHQITPPNDAPRATRTSRPGAGGDGRASPPSRPPPT